MSAAIVQKNTTTSIYFECGDLFNAKKSTENSHSVSNRINESKLQEITFLESDSLEEKDKIDYSKENDQYRLHNALTRTISQPQPDSNVASLVTTLIENLGNINLHRKLERTQSEPLPQQVNTSRYKTELCRPFEEAGECKYGEKCQFAHGYHELRNLQRHPKYKTEYCRTFHSVGFCPYGPRCHFVHNADEARALQQQMQQSKLQNHSNVNNCMSTYSTTATTTTITQQQQQQQTKQGGGNNAAINHSLPLSPPLSMSTGSDRESPTGSLSLSPTSSMTNFPFGEQISPATSVFQTTFSYGNTPPESPNAPMSPVNTPPPNMNHGSVQNQTQIFIKPITIAGKQVLQKSSSSPIAIIRNVSSNKALPAKVNSTSSLNSDDARLPVFNRLRSSALDNFPNVAL